MSAAVHHDDTRQSASPWCFRERERERERVCGSCRDMMLGDTTHLLPSGWPGWPMRPAESRRLLLALKLISLVSPSLSGEQHRKKKKKKSSWLSQAGAFRQSEELGQTIIVCSIMTSSDLHQDHHTPPTATTRSP